MIKKIQSDLFEIRDPKYAKFIQSLIPNKENGYFIGVRTPELRKYGKNLEKKDYLKDFLKTLPHDYYDENQLHAFILSDIKDFDLLVEYVNEFLPYIDNWATCDALRPKIFKENRIELLKNIFRWIESEEEYTKRFAIEMLMVHFLDEDFDDAHPKFVSKIRSDKYYVNMMIAWYMAEGLVKQYEYFIKYLRENSLDDFTHRQTIQKAVDSRRISNEKKEYLKSLRK